MHTKVDPAIPPHPVDAKLAAWLHAHEREMPGHLTMHIGIRALDGRIYRRIIVEGLDEYLQCVRFLESDCLLTRESHGSRHDEVGFDAIFSDSASSKQSPANRAEKD